MDAWRRRGENAASVVIIGLGDDAAESGGVMVLRLEATLLAVEARERDGEGITGLSNGENRCSWGWCTSAATLSMHWMDSWRS